MGTLDQGYPKLLQQSTIFVKMKMRFSRKARVNMRIVVGLWVLFVAVPWDGAPVEAASKTEAGKSGTVPGSACFENLTHLQDEMEVLLESIYVKQFREAIRRALAASIPEAISRIDGLKAEIESLRREIQHQVRVEKSAEFIARDVSNNPDGPLKPCKRAEKGGYCETIERYYMAKAANLANRGFLQALECYQGKEIQ